MRVLVSGGGTGGHIYPALALIREIKKENKNAEFLYIGTENGLESKIVRQEGVPFQSIVISGFKRSLSFDNFKTIYRFFKGVSDSKKYIKAFKPDVVIGTGGYVCGPVVYAAAKLGVPTIVHEQNSVPGVTNKFLSRYVDKVAICFEEARSYFPSEKVVFTGNPRASEVLGKDPTEALKNLGFQQHSKKVLVVGGSRGAKAINDSLIEIIGELGNRSYEVLYVTGEVHYENVMAELKKVGSPKNVLIKPFVTNMPELLAGIDVVVARAGATTLAELTALGIPSILIPSPYVTNNHQEKNARSLEKEGAAIVTLEKDLNGTILLQSIDSLLEDHNKLEQMKKAAQKMGIQDAATRMYDTMKSIMNK
ncbi:MAG: undecaprenyldiphospho-muramoylpentapeptide beta-N-acetylglucosaminyltransferase [Bacillaceae bacterium]